MKKSYVKPMIDFESFELAEFIAACGKLTEEHPNTNFYRSQQCGIVTEFSDFKYLFMSDYEKCNSSYDEMTCYTTIDHSYEDYFRS